jgi:hypothetical protein
MHVQVHFISKVSFVLSSLCPTGAAALESFYKALTSKRDAIKRAQMTELTQGDQYVSEAFDINMVHLSYAMDQLRFIIAFVVPLFVSSLTL